MGKGLIIDLSKRNQELENLKRLDIEYQKAFAENENSAKAINAYHEWYDTSLIYFTRFFHEDDRYLRQFENVNNRGNGYLLNQNYHQIHSCYAVLLDRLDKMQFTKEKLDKHPLVFISHSNNDKEFVQHLVDLLEVVGLTPENLFCSSVPGYWIGLGRNFIDVLKDKFQSNNILMIYVHSPRLYNSTISMNEMGAAWVLQSKHISILMSDMEFSAMKGVVTREDTSIKVDHEDAKDRLNQMKDVLCDFLNLTQPDSSKWEYKRDLFLKRVNI